MVGITKRANLPEQMANGQPHDAVRIMSNDNALLGDLSPVQDAVITGWVDVADTWAYASATTITVPTDATTKYSVGMKIKITQATGGTKYFYLTAVAATLFTLSSPAGSVVSNEAISSPSYSEAHAPFGFPLLPASAQCVQAVNGAASTANANATWTDFPSLSVSITPRSTASKILLTASLYVCNNAGGTAFRFLRNATPVGIGTPTGNRQGASFASHSAQTGADGNALIVSTGRTFLDAPSLASAITYKVQYYLDNTGGGNLLHINKSVAYDNSLSAYGSIYLCSLTAQEFLG